MNPRQGVVAIVDCGVFWTEIVRRKKELKIKRKKRQKDTEREKEICTALG